MNTVVILFSIISALGGLSGLASFLQLRSNNKKIASESQKLVSEGRKLDVEGDILMSDKALEMYEAMSVRATAAEKKADEADKKASQAIAGTYELIDHIYLLRRVMADHKIEPPPFRFPTSITGVGAVG